MLSRKPRTHLKKWLDRHGIEQKNLAQTAGVSLATLTKVCRDTSYIPTPIVMKKLLKAIRRVDGGAKASDFWEM